jgi:hypothetical protein
VIFSSKPNLISWICGFIGFFLLCIGVPLILAITQHSISFAGVTNIIIETLAIIIVVLGGLGCSICLLPTFYEIAIDCINTDTYTTLQNDWYPE